MRFLEVVSLLYELTLQLVALGLQVHLSRVVGLVHVVLLQLLLELLLTLRQLLLNALDLLAQAQVDGVVFEELVHLVLLHQEVLLNQLFHIKEVVHHGVQYSR